MGESLQISREDVPESAKQWLPGARLCTPATSSTVTTRAVRWVPLPVAAELPPEPAPFSSLGLYCVGTDGTLGPGAVRVLAIVLDLGAAGVAMGTPEPGLHLPPPYPGGQAQPGREGWAPSCMWPRSRVMGSRGLGCSEGWQPAGRRRDPEACSVASGWNSARRDTGP